MTLNKGQGYARFRGKLFVCQLGIPHTKLHTKFDVSSSGSLGVIDTAMLDMTNAMNDL